MAETQPMQIKNRAENLLEIPKERYIFPKKKELHAAYNTDYEIKFKTAMLRPGLCDYSDAYILVNGTVTVANTAAENADAKNKNKKLIS